MADAGLIRNTCYAEKNEEHPVQIYYWVHISHARINSIICDHAWQWDFLIVFDFSFITGLFTDVMLCRVCMWTLPNSFPKGWYFWSNDQSTQLYLYNIWLLDLFLSWHSNSLTSIVLLPTVPRIEKWVCCCSFSYTYVLILLLMVVWSKCVMSFNSLFT